MSPVWHYIQNGVTHGSISEEELQNLIRSGVLRPSEQVWRDGMTTWGTIQEIPELAKAIPSRSPVSSKNMGNGTKIAIGCGGCFGLMLVLGLVITLVGSGSKTSPITSSSTVASGTGEGSLQNPIKIPARKLYRAYAYSDESSTDALYKGKYVLIEGIVSDTDQLMKAAHNNQDLDNVLDLDTLVKTIPSTDKLNEEARVHEVSIENLRKIYPGIDLELGVESSRPAGGGDFISMGMFGHIHFTFNTRASDLGKLKRGSHIWILGRVEGWLKKSVIINDCQITNKP